MSLDTTKIQEMQSYSFDGASLSRYNEARKVGGTYEGKT